VHEHHQDVIIEQHKDVIHEHHQKVIHKHIQPVIQEEVVHEIHKPVIHEKVREVIHEHHKPIVHEEHVMEVQERTKAPVVQEIYEKPIVEREVLAPVIERTVEEARIIEKPLPANLGAPIITEDIRVERRDVKDLKDKDLDRRMENLNLGSEGLSEDEIIKLRVKGALESLKSKVIEGEGKELQEKNVMTKDVRGEEKTEIM